MPDYAYYAENNAGILHLALNDGLHFHNFHHAFTVFAVSADVVRAVLAAGAYTQSHFSST
jgi:hypothetical protein